jgi:hypothetical protein
MYQQLFFLHLSKIWYHAPVLNKKPPSYSKHPDDLGRVIVGPGTKDDKVIPVCAVAHTLRFNPAFLSLQFANKTAHSIPCQHSCEWTIPNKRWIHKNRIMNARKNICFIRWPTCLKALRTGNQHTASNTSSTLHISQVTFWELQHVDTSTP